VRSPKRHDARVQGLEIRRLGPGDEDTVLRLAEREPPPSPAALLADERMIFLVALDGLEPVAFVLAHELPRRHGDPFELFVYELDVWPAYRRRGVATALLRELERLALARGIRAGFVLTDRRNEPAMRLYRSVGGRRPHENVLWEFEYGPSREGRAEPWPT
jgi:aminoglycoside 3-N-acetyltransferase I